MTSQLSRRRVLAAAAGLPAALVPAGWLLTACSGGSQEQDSGELDLVRVNTGLGLFQGREAYLTVAEQRGFFAEERIQIEVLPGEGTEHNLDQLAAGLVDIATIDVSAGIVEFAHGRATDFVMAAVLHAQLLSCVMVLENSPIRRPRDLAGTAMGVIPGGTNTTLFPAFARLHGFDDETVEFRSPAPNTFAALLGEGRLGAIQQFVLAQGSIEAEIGEPVRVFPYREVLPEFYGSALGCTRQMAEENPDLVRRFCRAALRGLEYATSNPQEAGEVFAAHRRHNPGQPARAAAGENALLAEYVRAGDGLELGQFDRDRVLQSAALLRGYGVIDAPVDVDNFVRTDLFR